MATSIQITALDGIVNVNSLFTLAVFLGLAWGPADYTSASLVEDPNCLPGRHVATNLVSFQIYAFSSFLFSSLIALALKQAIRVPLLLHPSAAAIRRLHVAPDIFGHVSREVLRVGMLVSGVGSVVGSVFLMLALVSVVQVKLGAFGCGDSGHTVAAVVPLVILVPVGLLLYVSAVLYAFTRACCVHPIDQRMTTPASSYICLTVFLVLFSLAEFSQVFGAGECGKSTTPDMEAFKLAPCASAAQDQNAAVSNQCCAQVKKIGQNPACLCAVMLSNTAKASGANPEIAITIPKRCNIADRPVGYKCGPYTLP